MGEPPELLHPVVWMGRLLAWFERRAPRSEWGRLVYGAALAAGVPAAWAVAGHLLEMAAPWPVQAVVLKPAFAGRSLHVAAQRVEDSLARGDLDRARVQLRWLVSRPTHDLDDSLIAAAAIESLAENFVDSWVAPLLAYALFGLGGAYAYRAINTADAMWGYHSAEYEWLGKTAARLDDLVNWWPSRIGAVLLLIVGRQWTSALRVWLRDARLTESPNAGQAMAVAAGQLGVRLEKLVHYRLHAEARSPESADIAAARRLIARGMLLSAILAVLFHALLGRRWPAINRA